MKSYSKKKILCVDIFVKVNYSVFEHKYMWKVTHKINLPQIYYDIQRNPNSGQIWLPIFNF